MIGRARVADYSALAQHEKAMLLAIPRVIDCICAECPSILSECQTTPCPSAIKHTENLAKLIESIWSRMN